ncbi:ssDNA-binding domain-containing protein [Methylocystis sp. WRRC1]|uniref:ArdC family protein n=1 Tax=Methylocystis sp. WRRC1 TaxID=1732014 RepID=UPI001D14F43B|nr:zincin-like metallopeptidase domain-containing protein [Methylocystis sp. WRRC1]MCC3246426.1 ssDNA-binding domain-containing protein [Methylocystis sp. WRRC1]
MHIAAVYENVTKSIIAELEGGTAPWIKPWKSGTRVGIMPANAINGHHYRGINVPILWHAADERGFPKNAWLTFKQALDAGGHVRKGEKGTQIVFTKRISVTDDDDEARQISMLRAFTVFNVAQVEGVEALAPLPEPPLSGVVETFVSATGADIRHGGDRACYVPSRDFIALPNASDFESEQHYEATKLHELVHWSGNEKRLKRDLANRFGTKAYAAEELVAELGAAFLCAHLGVEGRLRHDEYIASWLSLLKEDDRAIFTAASKASAAADYLRSFSEKLEESA